VNPAFIIQLGVLVMIMFKRYTKRMVFLKMMSMRLSVHQCSTWVVLRLYPFFYRRKTMQINVKVNEKNVLEETYTITLDRDEIEQVEQALLDQRFKIMTFIQSARGEEALDLIDEHEDLKQLEKLIERIQLSHLFIYGENK
jgi:hypothetical protein